MENERIDIVDQDLEEIKILRAINRDEIHLGNVDWKHYLSSLVRAVEMAKNTPQPISYIGSAWGLMQVIDDYARRADILAKWQDLAPQCFPTMEAADAFRSDVEYLKNIYYRLRGLVLMQGAQLPHLYDNVDGGKGLNEMALLWSDEYVTASDMVLLASEIHNSVSKDKKEPLIEYFMYSSRNYGKLPFENIYDFSRNLFLSECFRQYLTTGKMYTSVPITLAEIKRKLRNACFEEYIRLRIAQIEEEMEEDNELLLDPTIDDIYNELLNQERSVVDREYMYENFRGSQAYSDRWYRGRPEVLRMIQYFIEYLKWKMEHLHDEDKGNTVVYGDYVAGNKYTGTVIENVAAGGIGIQMVNNGTKDETETCAFTAEDKRGPKYLFLFADKNGNKDKEREQTEKERLISYLRDYNMDSIQLDSSKRNDLYKVVICFCKKWVALGYASQTISGTAVVRFLVDVCGIDKKANEVSAANVLGAMLKNGEYDKKVFELVCEYF